jgi:hypothetical protein
MEDTVTGQQIEIDAERVQNELDRLTAAIDANTYREEHNKLFSARQALCWVMNPSAAASPYSSIMGIREEPVNCLDESRPPQS